MANPLVSLIATIGAKNRALGLHNKLLWRLAPDMERFKKLTTGHAIIMGRRTFEGIGKPLPERTNIVITENPFWQAKDVVVTRSFMEALAKAREVEAEEIFVIGGAQIFAQAFPFATRLYLTLVEDDRVGDAYFPDYSAFSEVLEKTESEAGGLRYTFVTLEKITNR